MYCFIEFLPSHFSDERNKPSRVNVGYATTQQSFDWETVLLKFDKL
jgi:hypothetical protein